MIGAVAIVLAAMYMLRLISAVLHQDVGPAVSDAALDLRRGELAVLVPLVAILLVLSAWPDAISGHSFGNGHGPVPSSPGSAAPAAGPGTRGAAGDPQAARRLVRALAVAGAARRRRGCCCSSPCSCRSASRKPVVGDRLRRRLRDRVRASRSLLADAEPARRGDRRRLDLPRPLGRGRADPDRRLRRSSRCSISYGERWREEHVGRVLRPARGRRRRDGVLRRRRRT